MKSQKKKVIQYDYLILFVLTPMWQKDNVKN